MQNRTNEPLSLEPRITDNSVGRDLRAVDCHYLALLAGALGSL